MKLLQEDVAKRVGRDRSSISNSLRALKWPEKLQNMMKASELSTGHAKAIMAISDSATQIMVANEVVCRFLSVRETETLVARTQRAADADPPGSGWRDSPMNESVDPNVKAAADNLRTHLGTQVRFVRKPVGGKVRRKIEIEFYSDEELDHVYTYLMDRGH